jgi:hypothetical protein
MRVGKTVSARQLDFYSKLSQAVQHALGIVRMQQIAHVSHAFGQCSQQQHAIGDALGTGQTHCAVRGHQGREIEEFVL